jgi:hypothetical protein
MITKIAILCATLTLMGCYYHHHRYPEYVRYFTRPDGSYGIEPCSKEEANTVDGTHNVDRVKEMRALDEYIY